MERQWTTRAITREVNRLGLPAPRGRAWALSTVAKLLRAPIYQGTAHWNRSRRPEAEWISIPVPSLIDPDGFARAQAQLSRNRSQYQGRPAHRVYLLKGLVRCGICGRRMPGRPMKRVPYYRCTGQNGFAPRPCPTPQRMRADRLEGLVWTAVSTILRNPDTLHAPMVRYQDQLGVSKVEITSEVEHLRSQLATVDRQERRLLELYLDQDAPLPAGVAPDRIEALGRQRPGSTPSSRPQRAGRRPSGPHKGGRTPSGRPARSRAEDSPGSVRRGGVRCSRPSSTRSQSSGTQ